MVVGHAGDEATSKCAVVFEYGKRRVSRCLRVEYCDGRGD